MRERKTFCSSFLSLPLIIHPNARASSNTPELIASIWRALHFTMFFELVTIMATEDTITADTIH